MVVFNGFEEASVEFRLVYDLADQHAVDSDSALASELHDAGVGIATFEKEMLVVEVDELVLNRFHSLLDAFENQMMPVWRQSQKLPEI